MTLRDRSVIVCRLRARRMSAGRTQEELAHAVGVTRQTVFDIERGSMPRVDLALALAAELGTTVEDLWQPR